MDAWNVLVPLFFLTALVYATAGFGGGSTYLALLALFALPYEAMPQTSLLCNIAVVTGGAWLFHKAGHLSLKRVLPFVVTSIPAAYWGGTIHINKRLFTGLLAMSLIISAVRLLLSGKAFAPRMTLTWKTAWLAGIPLGAVLGFLSGLVGIGGGIYLAPLLLLMGWADAKQAAASASFFILVNSLAGLAGQWTKTGGVLEFPWIWPLLLAVVLGGQIGSRLGARTIPRVALQRVTAALILFVGGRLLAQMF